MAECLRFLTSDHWSDIMTILTSNIKVSIYFLKCGGFNGQFVRYAFFAISYPPPNEYFCTDMVY